LGIENKLYKLVTQGHIQELYQGRLNFILSLMGEGRGSAGLYNPQQSKISLIQGKD